MGDDEFRSAFFEAAGSLASALRGDRGESKGRLLRFRFDQTLGHMAEVLGIPRCEIGGVEVDGEPWSLAIPAPAGSLVRFLPLAEPLILEDEPAFILDVHLGKLARELRLLGFDIAWRNDWNCEDILRLAEAEDRIILSRDRDLLYRREVRRAMLLRSALPFAQLVDVFRRYGLSSRCLPLSRCSACGSLLRPAPKAELLGALPPAVARRYDEFTRCPDCGKVFWKGDHFRSIGPLLDALAGALLE
jgi:uncharacterized protein with PIN domain